MTDIEPTINQLTPQDAEKVVAGVLDRMRDVLAEILKHNYKIALGDTTVPEAFMEYPLLKNNEMPDLEQNSLQDCCSHAQSFLTWTLQDMGYDLGHFTFNEGGVDAEGNQRNPIPSGGATNHVALTVDIPTTEGTKTYLIDPTFKQFCFGSNKIPGEILANSPDGDYMVGSLLQKGFFELTESRAIHYASAFCNGIRPFSSGKDTIDFLTNRGENKDARMEAGLWPPKQYFLENFPEMGLMNPEELGITGAEKQPEPRTATLKTTAPLKPS